MKRERLVTVAAGAGAVCADPHLCHSDPVAAGANPIAAFGNIVSGALGSSNKLGDIAVAMVPLLLCSAGMLVTFAAGLWNIGVEGQMVAGALVTTWVVRVVACAADRAVAADRAGGHGGRRAVGLLIGVLRTYGRVNEIFAGLGMNYVMVALTNYLIFGPWKPADGATMSGTEPFPVAAWMPSIGASRASWVSIGLGVVALVVVFILVARYPLGPAPQGRGAQPCGGRRVWASTRTAR